MSEKSFFMRKLILLIILSLVVTAVSANQSSSELFLDDLPVIDKDPNELFALAVKYEHAEGFPEDKTKAAELYCEAARLGSADAQFALGWMYANGRGVERDDSIAAQLFEMAAEQGHHYAQKMIQYTPAMLPVSLPACLIPSIEIFDDEDSDYTYPEGPVLHLVHKLAPDYQLDPKLVLALISIESAFKVKAISPKNAQGLMQLIPATAQRFQVKDTFDPEENIKGGMAYLRWLLAFFKGDVTLAVAAYNAGEGAVEKYRGVPPYRETLNYVEKIRGRYKKVTHPYQAEVVSRASILVSAR